MSFPLVLLHVATEMGYDFATASFLWMSVFIPFQFR